MSFLLNTDTKRTNIGANRRDILEPDLEVGNLRPSRYFVISQQIIADMFYTKSFSNKITYYYILFIINPRFKP